MITKVKQLLRIMYLGFIIICLSVIVFACTRHSAVENEINLLRFKDNDLYGYTDEEGDIIINAQFPFAEEFSDGLAAVGIETSRWGYINTKGEMVVDAKYFDVGSFIDGIACVCIAEAYDDYTYMFIDKNGNQLYGREFDLARNFSEGYAAVVAQGDFFLFKFEGLTKWSYINTHGELATEAEFEDAYSFKNGYAAVKNNGKWGLVDKDFNLVVDYLYDDPIFEPAEVNLGEG